MLRSRSTKDPDPISPHPAADEQDRDETTAEHTTPESIASSQDTRAIDRIAELEKALAFAKEEQDRLREQLEKARHHDETYRETIEEHPNSLQPTDRRSLEQISIGRRSIEDHRDHLNKSSPHRSTSSYRDHDLLDETHTFQGQVAGLQYPQHDARRSADFQTPSRTSIEWQELTSRLHNTEKESQQRLQQLLDLKHSISAMTRVDNQVTDSDFTERVDQLYHRIREFVVSNYRPLVSNAIMPIFREAIYVGLPETGPLSAARQLASCICSNTAEYHEWRRATVRALEKSTGEPTLRQERQNIVHRIANNIQHQLFTLTSMNLTPQAETTLHSIILAAADLQHLLLMQKAQYAVLFFRSQDGKAQPFDGQRMEDVNNFDALDEDGDVFLDRRFAFCVFPCLEKFGDEFGDRPDISNVLLPARVCCGVG
ncbi:hypothetical protein BU24DRAFT_388069 [Aaosphaeria arxii CBS 175.79]|uniref:Uncharacterized protein n=1 Tax=Aaosphaeria arxii CBS 175.79 TaxID=1450172 RepID=A0A6A5XUT4_9PLEO|nr:uncharacterized protein BU24DRAFT_388069 [Aaosphaeria arxii CBS 175.79]KAF2017105.1 hypothetical protein BU24DRAFT_388069 [Aaosphaeria arxii CBS 175.79]